MNWFLVGLCVLLASFVLSQAYLILRLRRRTRHTGTILERLLRTSERNVAEPHSFSWFVWVSEVFPADQMTTHWSREDAVHELSERVMSDDFYQMLQRTAVMAPLVGILITVIGFLDLDLPTETQMNLSGILSAVQPLFIGLFCGAFLALESQVLLQVATRWLDATQEQARTWFDRTVWKSRTPQAQSASTDALRVLGDFSTSLAEAARFHRSHASELKAAGKLIQDSAQAFQRTIAPVEQCMQAFSGELSTLNTSLGKSRALLDQWTGHAPTMLQAIEDTLSEGAEKLNDTADDCRTAAQQVKETTDRLQELIRLNLQVVPLVQALERATQVAREMARLPENIKSVLDATEKQLGQAVQKMTAEVARVPTAMQAGMDQVKQRVEAFTAEAVKRQAEAATAVSEEIKKLPPTLHKDLHALQDELKKMKREVLTFQADELEEALLQIMKQWGNSTVCNQMPGG
jgi:ABC-type transporter Mla subunit MlaD